VSHAPTTNSPDAHGTAPGSAPGHDHEHPWFLGHHWANPGQQFEAGKLGMWLFLATEVLLFGGLFCGYAVWRGNHPELFKFGSQYLNTALGATNTAVLIASSLTMAWAVTAAQQNKQALLKIMLLLTLAGAVTFLVIKYFEYTHKFHEGIYPGMAYYGLPGESSHWFDEQAGVFATPQLQAPVATPQPPPPDMPPAETPALPTAAMGPAGLNLAALDSLQASNSIAESFELTAAEIEHPGAMPAGHEGEADHAAGQPSHHLQDPFRPRDAHMFFNIYFMMTGLHGIHVAVGIVVISWLFFRASRGEFNEQYFTPVDLGGLYWHVVDLIWIFLFPLFYLI